MKIKDCKHYIVAPLGAALLLGYNKDFVLNQNDVETYIEDTVPGLINHSLLYMGYLKIDNSEKQHLHDNEIIKIHIFQDNYWKAISESNE